MSADIWNHESLQIIHVVSDLFIGSTDGLILYLFLCDNYKYSLGLTLLVSWVACSLLPHQPQWNRGREKKEQKQEILEGQDEKTKRKIV